MRTTGIRSAHTSRLVVSKRVSSQLQLKQGWHCCQHLGNPTIPLQLPEALHFLHVASKDTKLPDSLLCVCVYDCVRACKSRGAEIVSQGSKTVRFASPTGPLLCLVGSLSLPLVVKISAPLDTWRKETHCGSLHSLFLPKPGSAARQNTTCFTGTDYPCQPQPITATPVDIDKHL